MQNICVAVCLLAVGLLAGVSCTFMCVCPNVPLNDPSPRFCASNSNGNNFNVTHSELVNWNCNHPENRYQQNSQSPCQPNNLNCPNNCNQQDGPKVCGKQQSPNDSFGLAFTVAEFASPCQLNLYNCQNPGSVFVSIPYDAFGKCQSIR